MSLDYQSIYLEVSQRVNLKPDFPLKKLVDIAELQILKAIGPFQFSTDSQFDEQFQYAVTMNAIYETGRMLVRQDNHHALYERNRAIRNLRSLTLPSSGTFASPSKIWARATRGCDMKTDQWLEPTIGQMIHFQAVAKEMGPEADPEFEHGALTGHGRDAFEWFFERPTKSDFSVDEVKHAWSRIDIHHARNRRRAVQIDMANRYDGTINAYNFLKVCAAHGLMIRIEVPEKKQVRHVGIQCLQD